jgi:hypothetical protein
MIPFLSLTELIFCDDSFDCLKGIRLSNVVDCDDGEGVFAAVLKIADVVACRRRCRTSGPYIRKIKS